jgi:geranylgeranyl pyrophosphate synthase
MRAGTLSAAAFDIASSTRPLSWPLAGPEAGPYLRLQAATITELYMAAGFLLDDVMDNDIPDDSTVGHETGLGTVVLLIADAMLDEAASSLPSSERFFVKAAAHRALLTSCDGQMRELRVSSSPDAVDVVTRLSVDDAMTLTEMKAGSLGELAAIIGAGLAAGAESDVATSLRACYYHYVTYVQMVDDLTDAASGSERSSDIALARPTVPAAYYYNTTSKLGASTQGSNRGRERIIRPNRAPANPTTDDLRETGTTLFTQLAAELQRNRAIEIANRIQHEYGGAATLLALLGAEQGEGSYSQSNAEPEPTGAAPA